MKALRGGGAYSEGDGRRTYGHLHGLLQVLIIWNSEGDGFFSDSFGNLFGMVFAEDRMACLCSYRPSQMYSSLAAVLVHLL